MNLTNSFIKDAAKIKLEIATPRPQAQRENGTREDIFKMSILECLFIIIVRRAYVFEIVVYEWPYK